MGPIVPVSEVKAQASVEDGIAAALMGDYVTPNSYHEGPMFDRHIAANVNRIALHRASLAQLGRVVLNSTEDSRERLQDKIEELEAVNFYLESCR
jgi:hypothetical protein